jgi:hypothetical protein
MAENFFAFSQQGVETVTIPIYVAYRQAPIPADEARPIGTAGPREHDSSMERTADARHPARLADHAPTGWVVAGAGPGAEHRFFATFGAWAVLEAEGVIHDVLILRFATFGAWAVLEAEGVIHDVLILRFAAAADLWGFLRQRASSMTP